jgi:hypothetical protein
MSLAIATFNPFSLQNISKDSLTGIKIQEVVNYADSRFRAILTEISNGKTDIDRKKWVQSLLHRELVSKRNGSKYIHFFKSI